MEELEAAAAGVVLFVSAEVSLIAIGKRTLVASTRTYPGHVSLSLRYCLFCCGVEGGCVGIKDRRYLFVCESDNLEG